jgi:hypothetical protein
MYRSMLPDPETPHAPAVGAAENMLGVRVPPHPRADVTPDADGNVGPDKKGLSVAPGIAAMPQGLVPERLREKRPGARGSNSLRVFRLGEGPFQHAPVNDALELVPTSPKHGILQPIQPKHLHDYQRDLAVTQPMWRVDEE